MDTFDYIRRDLMKILAQGHVENAIKHKRGRGSNACGRPESGLNPERLAGRTKTGPDY